MRIHFPSVAVGVAAVSVILVSMSQSAATVSPPRIEYGPNPRDMVVVRAGAPYTVPAGKLFVVTGIGTSTVGAMGLLRVDGMQEIVSSHNGFGPTIFEVPSGFAVPAGSVVDATVTGSTSGRVWGYLANQ